MRTTGLPDQQLEATFKISPLVRYTLLGLLASLVVPVPFLLVRQGAPVPLPLVLGGIASGFILLGGALSQRVQTDSAGITVRYAPWVPQAIGHNWHLSWSDFREIRSSPTSQGGRVHYLVNQQGDRFLLPMRIAGFARFLRIIEARTGLDTARVKPLAQPWMYLTLLVCVLLLLGVDLFVVVAALKQ
ncbi:MAG: hypothetical protein H7Y22_17380 [Gemmatimonadaceae bacterium]|nr:hypothetical protein [Gloeobacterales cyanobacterium ES-bin-141]